MCLRAASPYTPLCVCPRLLQPRDVSCEVSAAFNRKRSGKLDEMIESTWARRMQGNQRMYNAPKFRLQRCCFEGNGELLKLSIGVTDYKDSTGTVEPDFIAAAVAESQQEDGNAETEKGSEYLALALGVESLVVTDDNMCVLFRRSQHVAEYPGYLCFPGGHPEPLNCVKTEGNETDQPVSHGKLAEMLRTAQAEKGAVVAELFSSAVAEVVDEIGVPPEVVENLGLCGVIKAMSRKPDLLFVVRIHMSSDEVAAIFSKGLAREQFESEGQLLFVGTKEIGTLGPTMNLTPPSQACVALGCPFQ